MYQKERVNKMRISIIVPIYNSEKYLKECLDSIACQTLQNIQVLMIDDGSTDSSANICKEYAEKYDGFEYYHKENGGTASARNLGLSKATGEYIGFVDSDDYIEPDMFQKFYNTAKEYDADIVYNCMKDLGDYIYITPGYYGIDKIKNTIFKGILPHLVSTGTFRTIDWGNCARIFKSSVIKENNIKFYDKSRRCEDFAFCVECTLNSRNYVVLDEGNLYHYRPNENSKSRSYTKNMWKSIKSLMTYMQVITGDYKEYDFSKAMDMCVFYFACSVVRNELRNQNKSEIVSKIEEVITDDVCYNSVLNITAENMNKEYTNFYNFIKSKHAKGLYKYCKSLNFRKKRITPFLNTIFKNKIIKRIYMKARGN